MISIAHRELRNRSAEVLRAVQGGESFEVTNNGTVVAVLSPPNTVPPLQGARFRPPLEQGSFDLPRIKVPETTEELLDSLRGDS